MQLRWWHHVADEVRLHVRNRAADRLHLPGAGGGSDDQGETTDRNGRHLQASTGMKHEETDPLDRIADTFEQLVELLEAIAVGMGLVRKAE